MSDAAREIIESVLGPCPEWVLASHRKAVQPILDAYAAEQTAAEAAKHADCCVDREEMAALRASSVTGYASAHTIAAEQTAALRAKVALLKAWLADVHRPHTPAWDRPCLICTVLDEAAP